MTILALGEPASFPAFVSVATRAAEPGDTYQGGSMVVNFAFDGRNERAARIAKATGAEMVTMISEETRAAIRAIITRVIREGLPEYRAAKLIRAIVGLNVPQAQAVANYESSLTEMGHSPATVERLVAKYTAKKLRERAQMIARTETMRAINLGAEAGYIQAVRQNYLSKDARLRWVAAVGSPRTCDRCAPMNGKTKLVGGSFEGAEGPPLHPRCRCTVALVRREITPEQEAAVALARDAQGSGEGL